VKRIFMTVFFAVGLHGTLAAQNPQELYNQALVQERAAGNLQQAIQLYRRVAQESVSDRGLAAQALMSAARAYEKLGQPEAGRGLYAEVVRTYPEQRTVVADASRRLTDEGTIQGIVRRVGTGEPIPDAKVELSVYSRGNLSLLQAVVNFRNSTITDSSGRFRFGELASGPYAVRVERQGYFGGPVDGVPAEAMTTIVRLNPGRSTENVDIDLTPGGVIAGRVRGPDNRPAQKMIVTAYRQSYDNGRPVWIPANSGSSDDRGEFRLFWLPPGEYFVGTNAPPTDRDSAARDAWMRVYFPGTTDPSQAQAVRVSAGSEVHAIDLNINAASPTYTIAGTAFNPYERPDSVTGAPADMTVGNFMLWPKDSPVLDGTGPPTLYNAIPVGERTANGRFELRNVRRGSYDLIAHYQDPGTKESPGRRYLIARTPVEVRSDLSGIRLDIRPGVTLTGRIVAPTAIRVETLRVRLRNHDSLPDFFVSVIEPIKVDTQGRFSAERVPAAKYKVAVTGLPSNTYIDDILQSGQSVFDNGVMLSETSSEIQVMLAANGVSVGGVVHRADRKTASGATVVLVPPESRRGNYLLYRSASTDAEGKFVIQGVPPGEYTVFAWESVPPTAWQNREFLDKYVGRGRSLRVEPQSSADLVLDLIPQETQ
jgi:hypothetical protein